MWRVTRQLLTESVLLALAGGALGVLVAWISKEALLAAAPPGTIPRGLEVVIDRSAAIFTFALSAFVGIGAGLLNSKPEVGESQSDGMFLVTGGLGGPLLGRVRFWAEGRYMQGGSGDTKTTMVLAGAGIAVMFGGM